MSSSDSPSGAPGAATDDAVFDPLEDSNASPEDIENEIVQTRARLAASVDELADAANPAALAERGAASVKAWFTHPDGSMRGDRVAKTVGAVVGFLVLRSIVRKGS